MKEAVEEEFCTAVYSQGEPDEKLCAIVGELDENSGAVARTLLKGTQEEVHIAMDWPPGYHPKLNVTDCRKIFVDHLIDGCDGNDSENPLNWKGGGEYRDGNITYRIEPQIKRQPAPKKPFFSCTKETHQQLRAQTKVHAYTMIGGGFEGGNWGKILKNHLEWCYIHKLSGGVRFKYTFTVSDKEWIVSYRGNADGNRKGCIEKAVRNAGGPENARC